MEKKAELVSPAGNPEKLTAAVHFGADAVYFGGSAFNLRENADNLDNSAIEQSVSFCKTRGVKSVFLLNAFLHELEIDPLRKYIDSITHIPFDAVMVSDPGMLTIVREMLPNTEIHLSTQMSTLNHLSAKLWQSLGVTRIVLARECTLDDIRSIRDHTDIELETFIHGALCVAYSGRCLLSRYMSGRDSNQGNCAQPCRWNYTLMEEKRPGEYFEIFENERGTEILSSKDLCLLESLPAYVAAGVHAFKIEGRMKSVYYTANVTRVYRDAIDTILTGEDYAKKLPVWKEELDLVNHRPYTENLFNEFDGSFEPIPYVSHGVYYGYAQSAAKDDRLTPVMVANPFAPGEEFEAIIPTRGEIRNITVRAEQIYENGNITDLARPSRSVSVLFDKNLPEYAILRKRNA